jgi:hypothetical protein
MNLGASSEDGDSEDSDNDDSDDGDGSIRNMPPYTLPTSDLDLTSNSLGEEAHTDADPDQDLDGDAPEIVLSISALVDDPVDTNDDSTLQQSGKSNMLNPSNVPALIDHVRIPTNSGINGKGDALNNTMNDNNGSQSGSNKR